MKKRQFSAIIEAEYQRDAAHERELIDQGAVVSHPGNAFHDQAEEQLRLLKPEIIYVNSAFTKMTGYTPEDVIGKTPHIVQGPKTDRSVLRRLCENCVAGEVFHGEMVNYRKDHSEVYLEWTAGPVRNERGEVTHFAVAQRDVTERCWIEDELRRREEEFRLLFDLSAIGMAQVSPDGRYLRVNRKYCQMLGYSEDELLHCTIYDVTHPDDREASAVKVDSSLVDGSQEYSIEKRYMRKDGAIIWALVNWTIVRNAEGRPLHSVANIQDITARKHAEAEREELLLRERAAREAAEAEARSKDEFLAVVSHESRIRGPVALRQSGRPEGQTGGGRHRAQREGAGASDR
jgi:PAS domain S-box-containing protein